MLSVILLLGSVNAFTFDNVKSYDSDTRTVTIVNSFNIPLLRKDISTIKLNTPLNYKVGGRLSKGCRV